MAESDHPRRYTEEEARAIIQRALERRDPGDVPHDQLVETAREIGIAPADLEAAIAEEAKQRVARQELEAWRDAQARELRRSLVVFVILTAFLGLLNLWTTSVMWFHWPALGFALALALAYAKLRSGPTARELERARRRQQRRLAKDERRRRRHERQLAFRRGAAVFEEIVEHGVTALLAHLDERARRLPERNARSPEGDAGTSRNRKLGSGDDPSHRP